MLHLLDFCRSVWPTWNCSSAEPETPPGGAQSLAACLGFLPVAAAAQLAAGAAPSRRHAVLSGMPAELPAAAPALGMGESQRCFYLTKESSNRMQLHCHYFFD